MFSSTTMALSTNIPTAKEIPAREIVFKLLSIHERIIKVPTTEIGIATATTAVGDMARKNNIKTNTAKSPPIIIFCCTKSTEPTIYGRWSYIHFIFKPSFLRRVSFNSFTTFSTSFVS